MGWWARWVDETVWVSKNAYAIFSETFKEETFFNRGGFIGIERVPKDAVEALEREFVRRGRRAPTILVEDGRQWDKMRTFLASRGYAVADRMLVMEGVAEASSSADPEVVVDRVGAGSRGDIQRWTHAYLEAFYGDQRLSAKVNRVMHEVSKDNKASVLLARVGEEPVGCGAIYRSAGGVAGAYCIGTVPRFRGRGVAAAVVQEARHVAEGEKRRLVLQTLLSDRVERFYVKQGFKQAYIKSIFERRARPQSAARTRVPSGESFGVRINRNATALPVTPFSKIFSGFEKLEAVRGLFGSETERVISRLKVMMDSPVGYLRVDGETGNIIVNPEYLRTGDERHLYLDVIHELTHVRQFREGRELYDRRYAYFERPTEVEAYELAVEEARRIGMDTKEIVEYLRVDWVTEEEFLRFVSAMGIEG